MNTARRAENCFRYRAEFEQNKGAEQNFEQNKRFLRALPAGRISHFTSRIYPSLHMTAWPTWPCDKAKFGLDLITCTPRDKIHVVFHTGEPLHYSRIRSFKIPTIPSSITTSLHNKTSLNIIFTQFCILLSHQNAHQNKIYSLNTTTDFCVASAKLRPLPCGPIFLREFNFVKCDFFVCFPGLIFAIGETVYSSLELIFAIFRKPPSIWNNNILVF